MRVLDEVGDAVAAVVVILPANAVCVVVVLLLCEVVHVAVVVVLLLCEAVVDVAVVLWLCRLVAGRAVVSPCRQLSRLFWKAHIS